MKADHTVFVVDDEPVICNTLVAILSPPDMRRQRLKTLRWPSKLPRKWPQIC